MDLQNSKRKGRVPVPGLHVLKWLRGSDLK
jgi:hypothetical protein